MIKRLAMTCLDWLESRIEKIRSSSQPEIIQNILVGGLVLLGIAAVVMAFAAACITVFVAICWSCIAMMEIPGDISHHRYSALLLHSSGIVIAMITLLWVVGKIQDHVNHHWD